MADVPSAAQALFPGLPSETAVADRAPPPDRPAAQSIYGTPSGGLDRARDVMAAGVAQPNGVSPAESGSPAQAKDWLAEVADRGKDREAPERPTAGADTYLDLKALKLDPSLPVSNEFSSVAREIGIDQAQAGKLAALHDKALAATSTKYWSDQAATWETESKRQFGGRLDAMANDIRPLLNDRTLTTPAFRELLETYKLGNHPAVIDTLSRWSATIRNGRRR